MISFASLLVLLLSWFRQATDILPTRWEIFMAWWLACTCSRLCTFYCWSILFFHLILHWYSLNEHAFTCFVSPECYNTEVLKKSFPLNSYPSYFIHLFMHQFHYTKSVPMPSFHLWDLIYYQTNSSEDCFFNSIPI